MTIRKSIRVARAPEVAFRVFVEEIGKWWPLKEGFSFHAGRGPREIVIERRVGGRFFERFQDGSEFEIGRVTAYQPPLAVTLTWKAPDWEGATEIEVRFRPDGAGTTVELEHRGWEAGPIMEKAGKGYEDGWNLVLARYASRTDA
jgi:uncharacterized protein YndB with AHSA1/START domain